jgi:hypothetical protein
MMSTPSMSLRQEGDAELGDEEAGIGREGRCGWIDRGVGAVVELQLRWELVDAGAWVASFVVFVMNQVGEDRAVLSVWEAWLWTWGLAFAVTGGH